MRVLCLYKKSWTPDSIEGQEVVHYYKIWTGREAKTRISVEGENPESVRNTFLAALKAVGYQPRWSESYTQARKPVREGPWGIE